MVFIGQQGNYDSNEEYEYEEVIYSNHVTI